MSKLKIVPKTTRMTAITKALPDGDISRALLEKTIRETRVGERGINNRQSVHEYVGMLLDANMIARRGQNYRVTVAARTPGQIVIAVESELRVPLVRDLIERAIDGTEGVKIIDEV